MDGLRNQSQMKLRSCAGVNGAVDKGVGGQGRASRSEMPSSLRRVQALILGLVDAAQTLLRPFPFV